MRVKKALICLLALLLMMISVPATAEEYDLRGYEKGQGWKFVNLGQYPYEKDGAVAPVLWRVLEIEHNMALMITEYAIDTQQVIFETDPKKMEKHDFRRISRYEESDLHQWLNTVCIETLFGGDPVRDLLAPDPTRGELFILNMDEFRDSSYGFTNNASRQAYGTPYAIHQRGLHLFRGDRVAYWVANVRGPSAYRLAIVEDEGSLDWATYTRQNVGLRLCIRVNLGGLKVTGGEGTRENPFTLVFTHVPEPTATPTPEPTVTPKPTKTPKPTNTPRPTKTPKPTKVPTPTPVPPPTPVPVEEDEVLLSFIGDCSIGDSEQYDTYGSSYHTCIDKNGYAWPFSTVKDFLAADDLTVANLEVVFTERRAHSSKRHNLIGAPDHVNVLLEGSVEVVNSVNNHCMDFHRAGYLDSLAVLDAAGVEHFGTLYPWQDDGFDKLLVKEIDGIRFGFIGFSYPGEADKARIESRIELLKKEQGCDIVILSMHWGRETHMTPTSGQVIYAKEMIDAGADVIWGHHPHVIQPITFYQGKPIMFSTGNFTFGTMSQVDPSTGIFQLVYEKVEDEVQLKRLQVIPCKTQPSPKFCPRLLSEPKEREEVFRKLVYKRGYAKCDNPPEYFLKTGVVNFENGVMVP